MNRVDHSKTAKSQNSSVHCTLSTAGENNTTSQQKHSCDQENKMSPQKNSSGLTFYPTFYFRLQLEPDRRIISPQRHPSVPPNPPLTHSPPSSPSLSPSQPQPVRRQRLLRHLVVLHLAFGGRRSLVEHLEQLKWSQWRDVVQDGPGLE